VAVIALVLMGIACPALRETIFGPTNAELAHENGDQLVHLDIHSKAVGRDLGVNVIVPPHAGPRGERSATSLGGRSRLASVEPGLPPHRAPGGRLLHLLQSDHQRKEVVLT
jgi:hypothetical protein